MWPGLRRLWHLAAFAGMLQAMALRKTRKFANYIRCHILHGSFAGITYMTLQLRVPKTRLRLFSFGWELVRRRCHYYVQSDSVQRIYCTKALSNGVLKVSATIISTRGGNSISMNWFPYSNSWYSCKVLF